MQHLDLFSGIGGFALAARWAGIETVQFVEKDLFCQKVLRKHWPNVPIYSDIKEFHYYQKVDLLTGGFPCQPFSVAGKRQGSCDERYLWPEMFRVIRGCKPRWIIAENVPGIIPMLDPILQDLEDEGYTWRAYLVPASALGAPHKRERLWIIANRNSERCDKWGDNRQERHIQDDWQRYIAEIQSEWSQFFPLSWTTFNAQDWLTSSNTNSKQCNQRTKNKDAIAKRSEWSQSSSAIGNAISHTNGISINKTDCEPISAEQDRKTWENNSRESRRKIPIFNWEKDKPPISGVDDGIPNGLDRNKSLGNAVIPQIPFIFMKIIQRLN